MTKQSGSVIRNAARAIEKHGWTQYAEGGPEYGMCIRGAIFYVQEVAEGWQAEEDFSEWMNDNGFYSDMREFWIANGADPRTLTTVWNDWPDRTKDEVLLYMNKFADEVDPQGP